VEAARFPRRAAQSRACGVRPWPTRSLSFDGTTQICDRTCLCGFRRTTNLYSLQLRTILYDAQTMTLCAVPRTMHRPRLPLPEPSQAARPWRADAYLCDRPPSLVPPSVPKSRPRYGRARLYTDHPHRVIVSEVSLSTPCTPDHHPSKISVSS
jgi:hypothetical protein